MTLLTLAILLGAYLMASIFYRAAKNEGTSQLRSEITGLGAVWLWFLWVGSLSSLV